MKSKLNHVLRHFAKNPELIRFCLLLLILLACLAFAWHLNTGLSRSLGDQFKR